MDIHFHPLFAALYPEIHYTFDLFFNRLRHSQPEIVIDCPHRIDPGKTIPLLCMMKHANRFPVSLHSIKVHMRDENETTEEMLVWNTSVKITNYLWYRVFHLEPKRGYSGTLFITTELLIERDNRLFRILNHNYRGLRKSPLRVYVAREPLPAFENWYYGESHCHSFHSDDQVEFGAPVQATVEMAEAVGLGWMAVTDHSYDLDDIYENTLWHDDKLLKWKRLKKEIEKANATSTCFVLLGEEISCGNARKKNIHLLAYGIQNFIPGSGDGAERWFRTKPELSLKEVLKKVKTDGGVAYASHPEERFTIGERFMLRRGHWEETSYNLPDYSGLQFWNGKRDKAFREGYKRWIKMLLQGRRLFFMGGDDSHGDFNVFRQIRIPLLRMINSPHKVFGKVRTCVYSQGGLSEKSILRALQNGNSTVTSGPFLSLSAVNEKSERALIGEHISGKRIEIGIQAKSTDEFGDIERISLFEGNLTERSEKKREFHSGSDFHNPKEIDIKEVSSKVEDPVYLRLEAVSRKGSDFFYAYTNPLWLLPVS